MQFRKRQRKLQSLQVGNALRLEWLKDILAVTRTGSFVDAAQPRNLTPSAFSRRIQGIEQYLGVALFDRSRKPVQLVKGVADQRETMERLVMELRQLTGALQRGDGRTRIVLASQHALIYRVAGGSHPISADILKRW